MVLVVVDLAQHVEHEGRHVELEGFVIQKQLGNVGQVLAEHEVGGAVQLEHLR